MQHAVMRPPESELGQRFVGITDKITIREEQKLDDVPERLAGQRREPAGRRDLGQPY
jgi:hypothetical protein